MTSIGDLAGETDRLIRSDSKGRVLVAADQRDALLDAFEQSRQSACGFDILVVHRNELLQTRP